MQGFGLVGEQEKTIEAMTLNLPTRMVAGLFSPLRKYGDSNVALPKGMQFNTRLNMDGIDFLALLEAESISVAFFDPQYRGILDRMRYGNGGGGRAVARCALEQMPENTIHAFVKGIDTALIPSGHLFLWMDKFHLCTGFTPWLEGTSLDVVDMLVWDKGLNGMGYRTRRRSEYLVILQKQPCRAKGIWNRSNIPDVWRESVKRDGHTHKKPIGLQGALIDAVSSPNDVVIDPAAGSFSVMAACNLYGRKFLGCDLNG